jgi:hypothetical protein
MKHKHEPNGVQEDIINIAGLRVVMARCKCGALLTRETSPLGAKHNWEDWLTVRYV